MDVQRAIDDAAKGKLLPVYVIAGPERLLVGRCVEALRKATVGAGPRGLSEEQFDAGSERAARVLDACKMLPMMSKWRFVLVRGLEDWRAEDLDALLGYLHAPTPSTVLVLLTDKLDGRTKFAAAAKKKSAVVDAVAPAERDLGPWLEAEAKRRGASFAPGAAASLLLSIGADLAALSDALDRLQLFAAGAAISERHVDEAVASVREASQFDLPEAIADRNVGRALALLDNLARQRKPGLLLLAFVATRLRQLARARDALDRGEDPAGALTGKLPPFAIGKVVAQARRWSAPQLARALKSCAAADVRLKSGGGRDRDARVMEEFVLALTGPGQSAPRAGHG